MLQVGLMARVLQVGCSVVASWLQVGCNEVTRVFNWYARGLQGDWKVYAMRLHMGCMVLN